MCGIIGYIGDKDIKAVLMAGLSHLEYRGYDSAGIATLDNGKLSLHKEVGKLKVLESNLCGRQLEGHLGIGHTRWATHGQPSKANAHPHTDCKESIAVVHNGIIENCHLLRQKLIKEGHTFRSDTDTEVLAHLIERYYRPGDMDLGEAVASALREVKGTYAIGVVSREAPDRLIAARNGSPLIVGLGKNENFIASDVPAIIGHTKDVIFLDDYQMAHITRDWVRVKTLDGRRLPYHIVRIEWDAEKLEKGGFPHFMLKEIYEQPEVIRRLLRIRTPERSTGIQFEHLALSKREILRINRVLIQACGTSYHAGLIGKSILELFAGIPTEVDISSEFRYRQILFPFRNQRFLPGLADEHTLCLSISQSGETADTLMGLRKAKQRSLKALSICNVVGSTIARESDGVIYTHAGPEIGVASTKAYTAQLATLYLLGIHLGSIRGMIASRMREKLLAELARVPDLMQEVIEDQSVILRCAERYHQARDFLFLGRGLNYPNALEGALKLKEIAYIHASGHPAGEMKHGPIALIDEKVPVVCIAAKDQIYEKMVSNIREVKARKGIVIVVATRGDEQINHHVEEVIYIPETEEFFSPLVAALPMQLLAYHIAAKRGCDIDKPRNLAKSVTVE